MSIQRWWGFLKSLVIYSNPYRTRPWRAFYRELLSNQELVFDIGAHIGSRSRAMHAAGARVIALEPQAPFAQFLRWSLPKQITLIEAAVGSYQGEAGMAVSSKHPTVSSMRPDFVTDATSVAGFEHVRWDQQQIVHMVTLDDLIAQYGNPDYIKIDVEGFELEVLQGLTQPVKMLSLEFLPGFADLTHAVVDRLSELGKYRFNPVVGEQARFLWSEWGDEKSLRAWMQSQPAAANPSDLFARLESPELS